MQEPKLWVFDFDGTIVRLNAFNAGFDSPAAVDSVLRMDRSRFLRTFFGRDAYDQRAFLDIARGVERRGRSAAVATLGFACISRTVLARYFAEFGATDLFDGLFARGHRIVGREHLDRDARRRLLGDADGCARAKRRLLELLRQRSGFTLRDMVLIDDSLGNLDRARRAGANVYHVDNAERTREGLVHRDGVALGLLHR